MVGDGIVLRPARTAEVGLFRHLVTQHGGHTSRLGAVALTDLRGVADAMWNRAAALFVAELDARPLAFATVFDLRLVHQTAWIDLLAPVDLDSHTSDAIVADLLDICFTTWPLRAVRTADPVGSQPLLAAFGDRARREGRQPGRCPGVAGGEGEIRAIWRADVCHLTTDRTTTDGSQSRAR